MASLAPGTYRLVNVKSGTALTVSDGGEGHIFCWQRHGGKVQQVRTFPAPNGADAKPPACRSGDRYRFKNSGTGQYLTVSNTENATEVYGGKHPASWDLDRKEEDRDSYMIRFRDYNRVLDLDGWGAGYNGNRVHMSPQLEWMPHRSWRFERLGNEPGEANQRLHVQIAERDQRLVEKDQQLADKDRQLAELAARLAVLEQEQAQTGKADQQVEIWAAEATGIPRNGGQELPRCKSGGTGEDSVDQSTLLAQAQEALRSANETIRDRDITILTLRNQLLGERMEHETTRQAKEIQALREKVASIEQVLEQVSTDSFGAT
ncbi:hypothetical protein FRC10_004807 [Ceratobasidium sp. 414]|nr:hypothetical protein FRC10_004807 [Ceratobasidium sp. 414]